MTWLKLINTDVYSVCIYLFCLLLLSIMCCCTYIDAYKDCTGFTFPSTKECFLHAFSVVSLSEPGSSYRIRTHTSTEA